jgi:hypothetical protein
VEILPVFKHAMMISFFVFVMMLIVDFVDTVSKRRISDLMQGGLWRQYFLSAFLGSTPGCLSAFMNVSLPGDAGLFQINDCRGLTPSRIQENFSPPIDINAPHSWQYLFWS